MIMADTIGFPKTIAGWALLADNLPATTRANLIEQLRTVLKYLRKSAALKRDAKDLASIAASVAGRATATAKQYGDLVAAIQEIAVAPLAILDSGTANGIAGSVSLIDPINIPTDLQTEAETRFNAFIAPFTTIGQAYVEASKVFEGIEFAKSTVAGLGQDYTAVTDINFGYIEDTLLNLIDALTFGQLETALEATS